MSSTVVGQVDVSAHDSGPLLGTAVLLARYQQELRRWVYESNQSEPVEPILEELRLLVSILGNYLYRWGLLEVALVGKPREQVHGLGDLRQVVRLLDQRFPWLVRADYSVQAMAEVPMLASHEAWGTLDAGIEKLARVQTQRAIESEP